MRTLTYYEKYHDIHTRWGLDGLAVKSILDKAFNKLIDEIVDLTPWNLHNSLRDCRTNDEYLCDLLEGRLFEDLLVLWYQTNGHRAKRIGFDCDDKVFRSGWTKTNTYADLEVDGKLIEVQVSRGGKRAKYHIKKYKGDRILAEVNTLQFIVGDEYFLVGAKDIAKASLVRNQCYGGKECYELINVEYKSFSNLNVV